jgi:hypothetical protein
MSHCLGKSLIYDRTRLFFVVNTKVKTKILQSVVESFREHVLKFQIHEMWQIS